LIVLPFAKVALAFIWLAPSFERLSLYAPYITLWFNFENTHRQPLLNCVYIFWPSYVCLWAKILIIFE
jgi:hypothetical protein